ncbi:aminotransferase class V-fold PLP-dependent enzyme [Pararhodospirillum photometricum]|uniref:aminotransferase class V-fold PLP-dependent enzyme n=1 Tax=Pararhodospirillum photometricum TaxID=1084 RepID=UPI00030CCB32|nr:aminotransferase class V-fold PLP-dependent enzyme [Pararhodospirillum photometricum]
MSAPPFAWLLTPGPLSTTDTVKQAMLHDWGSWDGDFRALTAEIRARLHRIAGAGEAHTVVPVQGSGTTAVEAALLTLVGRTGRILILVNGAYGRRMVDICTRAGLPHAVLAVDETQPVTPEAVARAVATEGPFTHAAVVQVETSTGLLNPVEDVAAVLAQAGVRLIIDAMSAFGVLPLDPARVPFDALVFSTNKCLEGVPAVEAKCFGDAPSDLDAQNRTFVSRDLRIE